MKGLILTNAYYATEDVMYQPRRLKEEFEKLGVAADVRKNDFFPCSVMNSGLTCGVSDYEFCIYLDKDKYALKALSLIGIPLFNSYEGIEVCDDKMNTYLALAGKGIKLPDTLPGPLCFSEGEKVRGTTLDKAEKTLGYPMIVKESFGSLGKGVYLARTRQELETVAEKVKLKPHLYQRFIRASRGRDVRVILVGGKIVGAMKRESESDFRSNIAAGGRGEAYTPDEAMRTTAVRAAEILGLDYCGIDFLFADDNEPVLCEVNSNAFFKGFEAVTGINVAKTYAEYVKEKILSDCASGKSDRN